MFEYKDLYVHVVLGEVAHKWLIVKTVSTPDLGGRITQAGYDNDTLLMSTQNYSYEMAYLLCIGLERMHDVAWQFERPERAAFLTNNGRIFRPRRTDGAGTGTV